MLTNRDLAATQIDAVRDLIREGKGEELRMAGAELVMLTLDHGSELADRQRVVALLGMNVLHCLIDQEEAAAVQAAGGGRG